MPRQCIITIQLGGEIPSQELFYTERYNKPITCFLTEGNITPYRVTVTHARYLPYYITNRFAISGTISKCQPDGCDDDLLQCNNHFEGIFNSNYRQGTFNISVTIDD